MIDNTDTSQLTDFFLHLATLALCLLMQATAIYLFVKARKGKHELFAAILLVINVNLLMQTTLPGILALFYSYSLEQELHISESGILETVFFQFVYVMCFLATFFYDKNKPLHFQRSNTLLSSGSAFHGGENNLGKRQDFDNRKFIFIIIGIYLLVVNFSVAGTVQTVAQIAGQTQKGNSMSDVIKIYFDTMFGWTAISTAVIFLFTSKGSKIIKTIVLIYCLGIISRQLALGLRGVIFIFSILIMFFSYLFYRKINLKLILPLLLVIIPVFSYLGGSFRREITRGQLLHTDTFGRLNIIKDNLISRRTEEAEQNQNFLDALYNRLQATRNSVSLVTLYDEGKGVSLRPMISSVRALIPQQITGVKNFAGSSTDNAYGTAMHVVRKETYGASDMGPYLAASEEYWEGGIFYVIFSGLLFGYIWRSVAKWAIRRKYDTTSLIMLAMLLDAHHGEMSVFAPMALVIRLFWFQILPTLVVIYAVDFISKLRTKPVHYNPGNNKVSNLNKYVMINNQNDSI